MKPTQKITNYLLGFSLLVLAVALVFAERTRHKADAAIFHELTEARTAIALYRADAARLKPEIDSLRTMRKEMGELKRRLAIQNQITSRKNEILLKQVDSLNARLGIRPDF